MHIVTIMAELGGVEIGRAVFLRGERKVEAFGRGLFASVVDRLMAAEREAAKDAAAIVVEGVPVAESPALVACA